MSSYLCYDLRGIQSYIFQVPRLKYIVGGSALVDQFDRATVPDLSATNKWKLLSHAAGKGVFLVSSAGEAAQIQEQLTQKAHQLGSDIQFGRADSFPEASQNVSELYPYLPSELAGHPCPESGLYPTDGSAHETVRRRAWNRGVAMGRWFEERLPINVGDATATLNETEYFHDVSEGTAASRALGGRNRWAIICMDGNDMGSQFRLMAERRTDEATFVAWVKKMSSALDKCSKEACTAGITCAINSWCADADVQYGLERGDFRDEGCTVVPIRPLVVGGDDIVVLCHASHAATFVKHAIEEFAQVSKREALAAQGLGVDLWPATGGELSISAGILYCSTTMPLATAIPYAGTLLSLAKRKGRSAAQAGQPAQACVDFESVTETILDHPTLRRQRELEFLDGDDEDRVVRLTERPFSIDAFSRILAEASNIKLPRSILHTLLPGLKQAKSDRQVFYARLRKNYPSLVDQLENESAGTGSRWRLDSATRELSTDLIDMLIMAEEMKRMSQERA